jgi:hypothetical protein
MKLLDPSCHPVVDADLGDDVDFMSPSINPNLPCSIPSYSSTVWFFHSPPLAPPLPSAEALAAAKESPPSDNVSSLSSAPNGSMARPSWLPWYGGRLQYRLLSPWHNGVRREKGDTVVIQPFNGQSLSQPPPLPSPENGTDASGNGTLISGDSDMAGGHGRWSDPTAPMLTYASPFAPDSLGAGQWVGHSLRLSEDQGTQTHLLHSHSMPYSMIRLYLEP